MPRSKGQMSNSGSNDLGAQLNLLESGTLASVSMATNLGGLITTLQSLAIQDVNMACRVIQKDGVPVASLAIQFAIPGDLASFMSALWKSPVPATLQDTSRRK